MRTIAVINQKGGVGKTTTALNLAAMLQGSGQRVLAVDMDPQAQLTTALAPGLLHAPGMDHVLLAGVDPAKVTVRTESGLDLLPAGARLGDVLAVAHRLADSDRLLARVIAPMEGVYDVALIDSAPTATVLSNNAILAARELVIPVASDYLSLRGVASFFRFVTHLEEQYGHHAKRWLLITRFHSRRKLAREVREKLLEHFPDGVLQSVIHETAALAESPGFGQSIFDYDPRSRGASDYTRLGEELMQRGVH